MIWSEASAAIGEMLNDPAKSTFSEPVRKRAWNGAQDTFALSHTAALKRVVVTPAKVASHWEATLPSGLISMYGVETSERWLEPQINQPGELVSKIGYIAMPALLYFMADPGEIVIWYYSLYTPVTLDATVIDVPQWAQFPLLHLAICYTLTPQMIEQSKLRQFQERREAGTPEMNPMRTQAIWHLRQYQDLVGTMPPQDREIAFKPGR